MFKKLFGLTSIDNSYIDVCKIIDQLKEEQNALVFFPTDNILTLTIIIDSHLWQIQRLSGMNTFYIKKIETEESDVEWKKTLVSIYAKKPQITSYDNLLEVIVEFLVRNTNVYMLSAIDLTSIISSLSIFISEHKDSFFEIDKRHSGNEKNIWID